MIKTSETNATGRAGAAATTALSRRELLKSGAALMAGLAVLPVSAAARPPKKVIVAGAGLAGLSCAYELMERGHDVTLLEASRRTGGHVKTIRDPLPAGLYADVGAEQFPPRPAYNRLWDYVEKFGLEPLRWRRNENTYRRMGSRWYSDKELRDPAVLHQLGLNNREADFVAANGLSELRVLFFDSYIKKFKDEYQPFGVGLDDLDNILPAEVLAQEGASDAAIRLAGMGGRAKPGSTPKNTDASALFRIWIAGILSMRGLRQQPLELYHLKDGNQMLPDALAVRLAERVRKNCAVTAIAHTPSSVKVRFESNGTTQEMSAEHLVLAMSPLAIAGLTVTPEWPAEKAFALTNTRMGMHSRVLLQTRTPFWKNDPLGINLLTGNPQMGSVCETATEIPGERRLLFGTGQPVQTVQQTIDAFRSFYPGKTPDTIEQCIVHEWWKEEPTCVGCEREPFPFGQMKKVWPHLIQPVGRIHFAGAAYDNMWRGMEAATRSANRVAGQIDVA